MKNLIKSIPFNFLIIVLFVGCSQQKKEAGIASVTGDEEAASLQDAKQEDVYIDAITAAADNYTLLSEGNNVRVIRMTLKPGERDNMHSHKSESVYFIKGGKVKIYAGNDVVNAEVPDGHVMHHGPWTHSVENVGETTVDAIILEQMGENQNEPLENYIDAVEAAKENYKLLSQEGDIRVIEMVVQPGQTDNEHSHQSESVYFIQGGKVRIYVDGEIMEADIPDGHVMQHGPWTHRVENVGDTPVKAIIFERS